MKRYLLIGVLIFTAAAAAAQPRLSFHKTVALDSKGITSLAFSGDERYLAAGTIEGDIFLLDTDSASVLRKLAFHDKEISCLIFDSEGARLISGSLDKKIAVWDVPAGSVQHVISDEKIAATDLALSPDDKILVACGKKKELYCWDFPSGHLRGKLSGHKKDAIFVAFNRHGDQLLSVGEDRKMIFWDIGSMQSNRVSEISVQTMKGGGFDVTAAACSDDGQVIAVAVEERVLDKGGRGMKFERSVAYFDWETGSQLKVITGNEKKMEAIRLTPQSMYFISDNSTLQENRLSFWDAESGVIETSAKLENAISCFDISGRGRWLAGSVRSAGATAGSQVTLWALSGVGGPEEIDWSPDILRSVITLNDSLPMLQSGPPRQMAVLYFGYNGVDESIARSTTVSLENQLFGSPYIRLLERNQIDKIIDELNLQKSGFTVAKAVEIGRLMEAELMLLGSVDKFDKDLHITARLVEVSSGEIVGIREVTCTNASVSDISDMVRRLAPAIAKRE